MKIIKDDSEIWLGLSCLKDAYIEAMVLNEKIDPYNVGCDIKAIVRALQGDEAVKNIDLEITKRKINVHDAELKLFKDEVLKLRKEVNELKKGGDS